MAVFPRYLLANPVFSFCSSLCFTKAGFVFLSFWHCINGRTVISVSQNYVIINHRNKKEMNRHVYILIVQLFSLTSVAGCNNADRVVINPDYCLMWSRFPCGLRRSQSQQTSPLRGSPHTSWTTQVTHPSPLYHHLSELLDADLHQLIEGDDEHLLELTDISI